jgi:hypothetical protein
MVKIAREHVPTDKKTTTLTAEERRHFENSLRHNDKLMRQLARL